MPRTKQVLLLTPQLPYPPQQGTALRNFNLLARLARRHTIDLVTFLQPGDELTPDSPLHDLCRTIITAPTPERTLGQRLRTTLTSWLPDMAWRLESPEMWRRLRDLTRDRAYEIVQIEGIEMAAYGLAVAGVHLTPGSTIITPQEPPPRVVFDDHNAEYVLQQRAFQTDIRRPRRWIGAMYSLIQWRKLRRYERIICQHADAVIAVSEVDAAALRRLSPELRPTVIPNGVDVEAYHPDRVRALDLGPAALVFTGKMDFRPNVDAVRWFVPVLDRVREAVPEARFYIVGQKPHPSLRRLAAHPAVKITGRVPDTRPYIAGATVYVIPLRVGGGTRLKVLEAMALGKAIVSTRLGVEGFEVADGRELRLADTPEAFAERVVELLHDEGQRARLGKAARTFVESRYDWDRIVPMMERMYEPGEDHSP
ncbi:MAG TPA: glycosyltransferase [Caldilineae bacterium]|jgi:sugar transferase (PEP-CTERM/EpsH1 system associated)|nr:glycosyltransferase [Caldilineae bacterium]